MQCVSNFLKNERNLLFWNSLPAANTFWPSRTCSNECNELRERRCTLYSSKLPNEKCCDLKKNWNFLFVDYNSLFLYVCTCGSSFALWNVCKEIHAVTLIQNQSKVHNVQFKFLRNFLPYTALGFSIFSTFCWFFITLEGNEIQLSRMFYLEFWKIKKPKKGYLNHNPQSYKN